MIAEVIFRHVFCRKTAKNGVMIVLLMRQHNLSFFNHLIAALIKARFRYITAAWSDGPVPLCRFATFPPHCGGIFLSAASGICYERNGLDDVCFRRSNEHCFTERSV